MSFGNPLKNFDAIEEVVVICTIVIVLFTFFFLNIDLIFKLGIAVAAFSIMFLSVLASEITKQIKEAKRSS